MKRERFLRLFRKLLKETPHLPDVAEYLPVKGLQQLFSLIRIEEDIDLIRDIFGIEVLWGKRYN